MEGLKIMYKYCPLCRSPLKKISRYHMACSKCAYVYYNNPRPCSAAIIKNGNQILLVKRKFSPYKG